MDAYRERLSALLTKKAERAERKLKKQEAARAAAEAESGAQFNSIKNGPKMAQKRPQK